jgi:hypothetical protein
MWRRHYRKTLGRMQFTIALMTIVVFLGMGRQWQPALMFFLTMQFCAFVGAVWAARLTRMVTGRADELPLARRG